MKEFVQDNVTVSILGKDYAVKELTLAQKIKLLHSIDGFIRDILSHAFFRKNDSGGISLSFDDEVSLADLNIDRIILSSIDATPELLRLAIPDFKDWDNLPESASREALRKAVEVQDFEGYIANFIPVWKAIIR